MATFYGPNRHAFYTDVQAIHFAPPNDIMRGQHEHNGPQHPRSSCLFRISPPSTNQQQRRNKAHHRSYDLHPVEFVQHQIATSFNMAERPAALRPALSEYTQLNWSVSQLALCLGEKYCLSASDQLKWGYPMRQDFQQIIFYAEEWRDGQLVFNSVPATASAATDQSLAVVAITPSTTTSSRSYNVHARVFVSHNDGKNENSARSICIHAGANIHARPFVSKRTSDEYIFNKENGLVAAKQVARRESCDSTTSDDSGQESLGSLSSSITSASATVNSSGSSNKSTSSGYEDEDSCSSYGSETGSVTTGFSLEDIPSASAIRMTQPSPSTAATTAVVVPIDNRHTCSRCNSKFRYHHYITGKRIPTECRWHSGRVLYIEGRRQYVCCKKPADHPGCEQATQHVWSGRKGGLNGPFAADTYVETTVPDKTNTAHSENAILALDAEMVFTEQGLELAKISVVRHNGQLVYERLVRPTADIVDYNTRYSGITESQMNCSTVRSLAQVQQDLLAMISARTILVGHALNNDLRCLRILHGRVVDTAIVFPHYRGHPYRNALRTLVKDHLQRSIQVEGESHDSFEDARSSLALLLYHVRRHHAAATQ